MSRVGNIVAKYNKKGGPKFRGKASYYDIDASGNFAKLTYDLRILDRESRKMPLMERFEVEQTIKTIERKRAWNERHPNFDINISMQLLKEIKEE